MQWLYWCDLSFYNGFDCVEYKTAVATYNKVSFKVKRRFKFQFYHLSVIIVSNMHCFSCCQGNNVPSCNRYKLKLNDERKYDKVNKNNHWQWFVKK